MISKTETLLDKINSEKQKILYSLSELSELQKNSFGTFDNWAPKDYLAHLFSWELLFLDWYKELNAEKMQAPAPGYKWDNYYSLNLHIFESNKNLTFENALSTFEKQSLDTLTFANTLCEQDWFDKHPSPWYGKETPFAEPLWEVTGNHYLWANNEIQKWKASNI